MTGETGEGSVTTTATASPPHTCISVTPTLSRTSVVACWIALATNSEVTVSASSA
jgi:hypothetical protein